MPTRSISANQLEDIKIAGIKKGYIAITETVVEKRIKAPAYKEHVQFYMYDDDVLAGEAWRFITSLEASTFLLFSYGRFENFLVVEFPDIAEKILLSREGEIQ